MGGRSLNGFVPKYGRRAWLALLLAIGGVTASSAVSAQPADRSRFPEMLEDVRRALAPFDTQLQRNEALAEFGCGTIVRSSFGLHKKPTKISKRSDGLKGVVLDGEQATVTVAVSNVSRVSDGETAYARIKQIGKFPSTEPLADAPQEFISAYFGGTLDDSIAKPKSKIEAYGGMNINYWFVDGRLKEIEFFCDHHWD